MNDNKLIAEFMGYDISTSLRDGVECVEYAEDNIRALSDTHYHTSWDWLMPVVQKIMDVSFFNGEPEDFYVVRDFIPEISDTYKAVVEFINQYNNNENNTKQTR